jgi:hypothetical protein
MMQSLQIKTLNNAITIAINGDALAIEIGNESASEPTALHVSTPTLEWSNTLLDGKPVNYEAAEKAIAALGEGWRIPTFEELFSLVDRTRHDPAIDTEKFPDTKSTWYWSSTPTAWNSAAVWVVGFGYGAAYDLPPPRRRLRACGAFGAGRSVTLPF